MAKAALQRPRSFYVNVGVTAHGNGVIACLDMYSGKWCGIPQCDYLQRDIKLAHFDGELYAVGTQNINYHNGPCLSSTTKSG